MRIPLDYYRILGIPIQVTDEQLSQAYHDRSLQLPRREYSDSAIAARKHLLDEAHAVLSVPDKRAEYEAKFLEDSYEIESPAHTEEPEDKTGNSQTAWIEIDSAQLAGALLMLQELGEYELVISLGYSHLNRQEGVNLPQTTRADIVLTLALAYLELSREQWQQQEYENAAASGQRGLDLLLQENLFPSIQAEIYTDLYKLRPYRILELLALSKTEVAQRRKGMQLLKEMLQERQGIDGKGDDRSGLSIDDFLRFIQQLRIYLSTTEQQELFEAEAKRPSAVATYLSVYALMARGFAQRQPALMVEANEILRRLSKRQDVNLEQAVCALLLGQTEKAATALLKSHESEAIAFIREQSQGAPDLLPGLCLYAEHWLQSEVFSHFRDLAAQKASLKDYFANEEVQAYLEQLPVESEAENQSKIEITQEAEVKMAKARMESQSAFQERAREALRKPARARSRAAENQVLAEATTGRAITVTAPTESYATRARVPTSRSDEGQPPESPNDEQLRVSAAYSQPTHKPPKWRQRSTDSRKSRQGRQPVAKRLDKVGKKSKRSLKIRRLWLVIAFLLGLGVVGFLAKGLLTSQSSVSGLDGEQLSISLQQPPVEIPPLATQVVLPQGNLTQEGAYQVIQAWLSSKSQAFGPNHQVDQLNTILDKSLLSQWYGRAQKLKGSNHYWQYQHQITIRSFNNATSNQATVEADVREIASYYQDGKLNQSRSYDDNLRVRYQLVRQNERWLIQDIAVLQ